MSFSTQCPHCSTAFLITTEQIRVASGLVRCGVCASIFEADRHLFEVEEVSDPQNLPTVAGAVAAGASSTTHSMSTGDEGVAIDEPEAPSFMRHGRRRHMMRAFGWGRWTTILVVMLSLQLVWVNRNQLYAAAPDVMSNLDTFCQCQLGWPRRLHLVVVEQSTFQITPAATHLLQLSLKNQSRSTVLTPDLMVTLIDASDRPVIQKHFSHLNLQLPSHLSGGQSHPVDLKFQVPARLAEQIVGFRADLFYP